MDLKSPRSPDRTFKTPEINIFQTHTPATRSGTCPGCGKAFHEGGRKKCPAFNQTCRSCGRSGHFARVCLRKQSAAGQYRKPATPHAKAISLPVVQLSELAHGPATLAPTVNMQVSTRHGQASLNILSDSGAEISAAGPQFVQALGEYMDNLAPSNIADLCHTYLSQQLQPPPNRRPDHGRISISF